MHVQVSKQKEVVEFELENLELSPDPEPILTDLIHAVSISNINISTLNDRGVYEMCGRNNIVFLHLGGLSRQHIRFA